MVSTSPGATFFVNDNLLEGRSSRVYRIKIGKCFAQHDNTGPPVENFCPFSQQNATRGVFEKHVANAVHVVDRNVLGCAFGVRDLRRVHLPRGYRAEFDKVAGIFGVKSGVLVNVHLLIVLCLQSASR